jgi:hypothetical protein
MYNHLKTKQPAELVDMIRDYNNPIHQYVRLRDIGDCALRKRGWRTHTHNKTKILPNNTEIPL